MTHNEAETIGIVALCSAIAIAMGLWIFMVIPLHG